MNFFFTKFLNHPKTSTTFRADRTVSSSVHESRSQRVRAGAWRTSYQNKYSSVLSVLLSTISSAQPTSRHRRLTDGIKALYKAQVLHCQSSVPLQLLLSLNIRQQRRLERRKLPSSGLTSGAPRHAVL